MQNSDFFISFAIGVGGVQTLAIIGHTDCGMAKLTQLEEQFTQGLAEKGGWKIEAASNHYFNAAPNFNISNEVEFVLSETQRLRQAYPAVQVAPLIYKVEDHHLYLIDEQ